MAYAALDSLAKHLDFTLDYKVIKLRIVLREKQQMQSLHEKVVFLLAFLEDFPNEAGILEARITVAANQTEQFFDFGYHFKNENGENWERLCKELEMLVEEIDSIVKEAMLIKSSSGSKISTSMPNSEEIVVGIEKDLLDIKGQLCGEPSNLQVIPFVGMGGIGKTTLARYAYDDPSIIERFDIHIWVTISINSELRKILLGILMSSIHGTYEEPFVDDEVLVARVHRYLKGRRYLLVMDDMWDTDVWDDVSRTFPDDCNGSRIIVTTRELSVALYVNSSRCIHEMHLMSVEHSWRLLKEKVFGQEICPPELENIGKLIAEKCQGLPLAIVVIAGVLSKVNPMQDTWENIHKNVIDVVNSDQHFSDILFVSYAHLPCHLKPCFLYIGGFPEDNEINVSKLVKLWAAEGFLESKESKDTEELGYEYLEDLARRNLVLTHKKRYNGQIKAIKIHDILRDLCLRKARGDNFLHVINEFSGSFPERIEYSHRISVFSYVSGCVPNMDSSPVHSLLLFNHWALVSWKKFRLLRVVDAMSVTQTSFEAIRCIGELFHLRHLAFTCEASVEILNLVAESLYQLRHLLILIVRVSYPDVEPASLDTYYLPYLKFKIWRMPQLRHLTLLGGFFPDPSEENVSEISLLKNLQTLSRIHDFSCSERILEMILNIKKLGIVYSYESLYESGWSKYELNNLVNLSKLEIFSLYAEPYPNLKNDVSQNLALPMTLKRLTLSGCRLPWEDMTLVGTLFNLEVLKLKRHACHGKEWETNEGEFCQLKVLLIDSTSLNHWITESSHFPRLDRLILYDCNDLTEIPYEIVDIPTLELIEFDFRNSSVVDSAKYIKEERQLGGNDIHIRLLKSRSWRR